MFKAAAAAAALHAGHKIEKESIENDYRLGETLGTGSFATVKKGVDRKTGAVFAVKVIDKSKLEPEDLEALHTETEILKLVSSHPSIVTLHRAYETSKHFYMVMEPCLGGELFDRVVAKSNYSEGEAARTIKQVAEALQYCHSKGVCHRDLKPENLLYESKEDESPIKLADFGLAKGLGSKAAASGLSKKASSELLETACGTPGYVAPEVLKQGSEDGVSAGYGLEVDLWSLGVILYILLCGFPPFYSEDNNELFESIKKGTYDFPSPYWDNVSEGAKDLVNRCLTVDPRKRITASGVLSHPWLVSGGRSPSSAGPSPLARDGTRELNIADNLRKFNARRKFREGVRKVQALTRLRRLGRMAAKRAAINLAASVTATSPSTVGTGVAMISARPGSAATPSSGSAVSAYTSGAGVVSTTTTGMAVRPSAAAAVAGRHSLFAGSPMVSSAAAASSVVPSRFAPAAAALSATGSYVSGPPSSSSSSSAAPHTARHSLPPPASASLASGAGVGVGGGVYGRAYAHGGYGGYPGASPYTARY